MRSIDDPQHWHNRAATMRALAEGVPADIRTIMLKLAEDYDVLGDRAAKRREDNLRNLIAHSAGREAQSRRHGD